MLQTPEDFAAIDDPSTSTSEVVAYRPEWRDEDIALVCGIANAGGGRIVVSSPISDRAKKMKRFKKPFNCSTRSLSVTVSSALTSVFSLVLDSVFWVALDTST